MFVSRLFVGCSHRNKLHNTADFGHKLYCASLYAQAITNVAVSWEQAFHIYHVIGFNLNPYCHLKQKCQSFHFQKPCFLPLKKQRGPAPAQCPRGHSAPLVSPWSPQAGAASEPQCDWLCASDCVILCSRVMSPWFTITAHSVLLFSSEPLNGSLVFNKTAEPTPNSALTPPCLAPSRTFNAHFGSLSVVQR